MKKLFSLFSMLVLLSSNALPTLTYADSGDNELAIQILTEEVNNVGELFTSGNEYNSEFIQGNDSLNMFSTNSSNPHIVHDEENGLITVYTGDFSYGITIRDKNEGATELLGTGNYYRWAEATCSSNDFHVPTHEEWQDLVNLYNSINDIDNKNFGIDLKMPFASFLYNNNLTETVVGKFGYYQSSSNVDKYGNSNGWALAIGKENGLANPDVDSYGKSTHSLSLRCFKNDYVLYPKTVTFNPNGGAFSGMDVNETMEYTYQYSGSEIIPIYNIQIPNRESEDISQQSGWMFVGWYTKSGDNNDWGEEFDLSSPNSSIAYAKWLPFNDLNVKIGDYTFTIMDRNLGALETAEGEYYGNGNYENTNKLGNLYQFGNGYGFKNNPGTYIANYQESKISIPEGIEPLGENDNYYSYNKFIRIASNWYEGSHKNLWGTDNLESDDNNRKGPCPIGYHIPSQDEWKIIYNTLIKTNECSGDLEQKGKCIAKKLKLPFAGNISVYSPNKGKIISQGYNAFYLNSKGSWINFDNTSVYPEAGGAEAQGGSVRCFKDHQTSKEIRFNTNGGIFNDGEKIQDIVYIRKGQRYEAQEYLKIPVKTGWMFAGWYTTSGDGNWENQTEEIDIELASNATAYAKWLPFNDLDLGIIGLEGIKIMDRNLGSEGVATGILYEVNQGHEDFKNLGYYYQRGNSYGFSTNGTISYTDKNNRIDGELFGPERNYYNYIYKEIDNNPSSYILNNRGNIWGGEETLNSDKDKQGPCPIGYHVPDKEEFNAIINKFNTLKGNEGFCNNTNEKVCFAEKLKLPFAGYRGLSYSSYGIEGYYWTSSPSGTYSYRLWLNKYNLNVASSPDTNVYSIRCFKNNDKPINFETNGGNNLEGKYYTLRRRENKENKVTLPGIGVMEKDGYRFEGWYSTSGFDEGTEVTNNDIATNNDEITLYAKWKKNPEITLKSNGGRFETGEEEKVIKANKIVEKKLINDEYLNKTVRKVVVFTGAESINLSGSGQPTCNYEINIYNCDKEKNNECNIYKTINSNCGSKGCFVTNEVIPGDTITIEAETGYCNATPKFNFTAISNGINYYEITDEIPNIQRNGYEFQGWYEENSNSRFIEATPIAEDKTLYARWKALEKKAQETTTENVVYTNTTTVTVGGETTEEVLSGSTTLTLVSKEVEDKDVKKEEDTTKVQESEIKVTSDKTVEYEGGLEVYLEKTESIGTQITTGKVEGTIKFSAPVAVKIPISSETEYVKVQVKHGDEDFGFKGLTLNPVNECNNGEAVNDKYQGEDIEVRSNNGDKYATIYTCSASTFVAYTENKKPIEPQPSAGGGRTIVSTKNEIKAVDQEHNSANLEKTTVKENTEAVNKTVDTQSVEGKAKNIEGRSLTRGEVAVMTNILLDVYPQLTENRELNEVSEACENYTDEQNFTKDEKKAITRLCKLSIMGIHADDNKPLDEFMVNEITKNDEFLKVINRSLSTYTEKDFSVVKDALKKLEGDEENVVFGTVYDVFMGIKNIFSK